MKLHPTILEKDGRKAFVVLPYEEFERVSEELSDYQDLRDLREAKESERDSETQPLSDVRKSFGI
ncbi:MAG: type II toxin-antitoxin system Phd/YefM family antitoxin [Spirochaetaceae bacterium]|nr:MAG: type II toxin-antitoxin system Phd/YefM family antitoxin [Spirochaetaceae bacterium]